MLHVCSGEPAIASCIVRPLEAEETICVITFQEGNTSAVSGDLHTVRARLEEGGLIEFDDPYMGGKVVVNSATVTKVEPLPPAGL